MADMQKPPVTGAAEPRQQQQHQWWQANPEGDPPAGDPPKGGAPAGDPPAGDPPKGGAPAGDPPAGDPPKGGAPAGDPPAGDPPKGDWPADWRIKAAGGDEKAAKLLERYATPKDVVHALRAAQIKISSGGYIKPPKPDASAEELAAWRADVGLPEKPEGYEIKLSDGTVVGEADKPIVDKWLAEAHTANMPAEYVSKGIDFLLNEQRKAAAERAVLDKEASDKCVAQFAQEFGGRYADEMKIAYGVLREAPDDIETTFLSARGPDGTPLGSDPKVVRWLASLGRQINPAATLLPGSSGNSDQAIEAELAGLKAKMADRSKTSEYWHGPNAERNQARYRELLDYQSKRKG